jgi:hypothetical protein
LDSQSNCFNDQVAAISIQQAFSLLQTLVSKHGKYLATHTFSLLFSKQGVMADHVLIPALPAFQIFDSSQCPWVHSVQIGANAHGLPIRWGGHLLPHCS